MVEYLDFLGGELRQRRRLLQVGLDHRALIMCDHASQHSSKKYSAYKQQWCDRHNAVSGLKLGLQCGFFILIFASKYVVHVFFLYVCKYAFNI